MRVGVPDVDRDAVERLQPLLASSTLIVSVERHALLGDPREVLPCAVFARTSERRSIVFTQ